MEVARANSGQSPSWLILNVRQEMQSYIPDDDNGRVLRLLRDRGDALEKPRIIDYCFAFVTRQQALEFAASVGEIDYEVCISYYEEKLMWQAVVKKFMIPDHTEITRIEADLTARAEVAGGVADGWLCERITSKDEKA